MTNQELLVTVLMLLNSEKKYILKTSKGVRWFWNSVLIRIQTRSIKLTTARVLDKRTKYVRKRMKR